MGPRPSRPRSAGLAGGRLPTRAAETAPRPVAPIGAPSPRRTAPIETTPLPTDTRRALSGIVAQLRNVPRAIIGDPAEVVHFLGRTARALERLRDTPVPVPSSAPTSPRLSGPMSALPSPPRTPSALERAEAVFRSAGASPGPTAAPTSGLPSPGEADVAPRPSAGARPRIVLDRKGRGVRVEVRRAREAGQLEMPV